MNTPSSFAGRPARRAFSATALLLVGSSAVACQDRPICPGDSRPTAVVVNRLTGNHVDKVDVLLAVDNSSSMADKQALLALAVPDLVSGLVNPPCLDAQGAPVTPGPKGPLEACPAGSERPFDPVLDIHIGVVTSSLGSHGADTCGAKSNPSNDDRGHLVARKDSAGNVQLPTYQSLGFLAWDPTQKLSPPGEADLSADSAADPDATALLPVLADMITGAGQNGCGFESQLESWYRFLVDPSPYASLSIGTDGNAKLEGVDEALLAQRKAFLRPDSLVSIVLLTDEDDCSVREGGQAYVALDAVRNGNKFHMPAARAVCSSNPDDPCCFSCGQKGPSDGSCPADPTCTDAGGQIVTLSDEADPLNLRCWDQKRRFGIDFLYPVERYKKALTETTITDRNGKTVPNPLFTDLDPNDNNSTLRDTSMVTLTGIVGVPWQDIARDPKDLSKGFRTSDELSQTDGSGPSRWEVILGDPAKGTKPLDPLMIASRDPRSGKNPVTGDALVTSDAGLANPINGHEFHPGEGLQYACVFPLPADIPCVANETCSDAKDSPVYDPPYDKAPSAQKRAGAVPGGRFLQLLQSLGSQGVVGSVCPAQTKDKNALDFGYRPAIAATLSRLQVDLTKSCLPRKLDTDAAGQVTCTVIEASHASANGVCCDPAKARKEPSAQAKQAIAKDSSLAGAGYDCLCEIPQLQGTSPGEPLWTCQNDTAKAPTLPDGTPVDGYCYVDQTSTPPLGNPDLVAACPATEKRDLRFVGKGKLQPGATLYVTCSVTGESSSETCESNAAAGL